MPQPLQGCDFLAAFSQGSSFVAALGFVAESLWDSRPSGLPVARVAASWSGHAKETHLFGIGCPRNRDRRNRFVVQA